MGRVAAPYAVRGWIRIQCFTENLDSLLDYPVWRLGKAEDTGRGAGWRSFEVLEAKPHGQSLVAHLAGVDDRSQAEVLTGFDVAVGRDELPPAEEDEFYWDDLIGLTVVNVAGETLGRVTGLLETGAHDVLRVDDGRERLIPFVDAIVLGVDLEARQIRVDWSGDW